jgi:short-subunit dehydrogenase
VKLGHGGKVALVTGGRCGIGATIATELARKAMNLRFAACDSGMLRKVADDRKNTVPIVMPLTPTDLRGPDAAGKVFARVRRLDLLINSPAAARRTSVFSLTKVDLAKVDWQPR